MAQQSPTSTKSKLPNALSSLSKRPTSVSPSQLPGAYHEGHALRPSDYADNEKYEIIERISRSHVSIKEIVEQAQAEDPEAFARAVHDAEQEHPTAGFNRWSAEVSYICMYIYIQFIMCCCCFIHYVLFIRCIFIMYSCYLFFYVLFVIYIFIMCWCYFIYCVLFIIYVVIVAFIITCL